MSCLLYELPRVGGVADRGLFADLEDGGEVERVGAACEGFFELPVDPQPFQRRGQSAQRPVRPDSAGGPLAEGGVAADQQMRVGGVRLASAAIGALLQETRRNLNRPRTTSTGRDRLANTERRHRAQSNSGDVAHRRGRPVSEEKR